jgi:type VI secretion system secreted protein VgrG
MAELTIDKPPFDKLVFTIVSLVGEEAISELFGFDLVVVGDMAQLRAVTTDPIESVLLKQAVSFVFGEHPLKRRGMIAAVEVERAERAEIGDLQLRLQVVPHAWLLTQRINSRVFQTGMYVHQIVSTVLWDSGIKTRWNLTQFYPKRHFCMQYRESDYDFVKRVLAEEGIYFYFEPVDEFAGGAPPPVPEPETSTADDVAKVVDVVGKVAGGMGDAMALGGAFAKVAADVIKDPAKDPEADDNTNQIGGGESGPGGAGDVFVFADKAAAYGLSPPQFAANNILRLTATELGNLDGPDFVRDFTPVRQTAVERVELRDYDYRRPMLLLQSKARSAGTPEEGQWLEAYAHHGEYEKPDVDNEMALVHLEQHRAAQAIAHGEARSASLMAGFLFEVFQTERPGTRDGQYAVTWIRHRFEDQRFKSEAEGKRDWRRVADGWIKALQRVLHDGRQSLGGALYAMSGVGSTPFTSYENVFRCVEGEVTYRPERPRRTMHHVSETAVVVGPRKSEIHTDGRGRIKVRFHWDRYTVDGKEVWDDTRSCWIRVAQPWAGAGYGFQFFPRVGMEVLVSFVGGDPDRPVVVGAVYNATHPIPEPAWTTRSGIRTQTSPDGGGFNELSFDDRKGSERVYVHAQKDLDEVVNDTHSLNVKNNQSILVSAQQDVAAGAQFVAVRDNQTTLVGDNQAVVVRGSRSARVMSHETAIVEGNAYSSVRGVAVRTHQGDQLTTIEGDRNLTVNGDAFTQINGRALGERANAVTFVQGSSHTNALDRITLRALSSDQPASCVRLECGDSAIEVRGNGIDIKAETIRLEAEQALEIVVPGAQVVIDKDGVRVQSDKITLATSDGSQVKLDGKVSTMYGPEKACVRGQEVYLDTVDKAAEALANIVEKAFETVPLKLQFTFKDRDTGATTKLAEADYRFVADDYAETGKTSGDGCIDSVVPKAAKTVAVTLWPRKDMIEAAGRQLEWLVLLEEQYAAMMSPEKGLDGARIRLRNLGYDPGPLGEAKLDDATRRAMDDFNRDHPLPLGTPNERPHNAQLKKIYGE